MTVLPVLGLTSATMTTSPLFLLVLLLLRGGLPDSSVVLAAPSPAPGNDTAAVSTTTEATCEADADCDRLKPPSSWAHTGDIVCDTSARRCVCSNRTLVITRRGRCLPTRLLGQRCRRSEQCHKIDKHAECDDGYCKCEDGYYFFKDINSTSCLPDLELQTIRPFGADPKTDSISEENMVPVIVCLAIMFVGMCVALQLFSRARFRNQRTIFNSPNPRLMHLKLNSGKGSSRRHSHASLHAGSRRPSACSQLSPSRGGSRAGSRSGSQCGSPDPRRSSGFQHHGDRVSKDAGHAMANGPSESLQNGSPKVIVNRGRSPSPPAQA